MKRLAFILLALLPLSPAAAWWEYGHETVGQIAEANLSAKARANMHALMRAAPAVNTPTCPLTDMKKLAYWADCIKGDQERWGFANSWHYQNVNICQPFDLGTPCADGNCVSAQIDRQYAILKDRNKSKGERLQALAFLVHFVGDLHQPLHAGDRSDRGGNDVKASFGVMTGWNLHAIWDGLLADISISRAPNLVRHYSNAERAAAQGGTTADWSRESWQISHDLAYTRAFDGDPCGPVPATPVTIDAEDMAASRDILRQQVVRGGLRLARLIEEALG